jgi:hypothetical protein
VDCAPFIDWCRIAYTGGALALNPLHSPIPTPIVPLQRLDAERYAILRRDLPQRYQPAQPPPPPMPLPPLPPQMALGPLVAVIQEFRADYVGGLELAAARDEARRNKVSITTPDSRWAASIKYILRLCNVDTAEALPPIWHTMANQGHKQDRRNLQFALNQLEPLLGPSGMNGDPVNVSAQLATDIGGLQFIGDTADSVGVGLSIFMVSYPTVESVAYLRKAVDIYDQQMSSAQALTLQEAEKIRNDQKFQLPTTYQGVKQVCWVYHRLLAVVLGFCSTR